MPRGNLSKFHSGVLESPPEGNAHSEPKGLFVEYLGQISAFLPASFFFTQKRAKSSFVPRVHLFEPLLYKALKSQLHVDGGPQPTQNESY